jgi:mRNA-degrading endonuclease RelE of RelBE toxin-antitoxin system
MYTLLIKSSAEKDLRKLPRAILERLNARILALRDNPHPPGAVKLNSRICVYLRQSAS